MDMTCVLMARLAITQLNHVILSALTSELQAHYSYVVIYLNLWNLISAEEEEVIIKGRFEGAWLKCALIAW